MDALTLRKVRDFMISAPYLSLTYFISKCRRRVSARTRSTRLPGQRKPEWVSTDVQPFVATLDIFFEFCRGTHRYVCLLPHDAQILSPIVPVNLPPSTSILHPHSVLGKEGYVPPPKDLMAFMVEYMRSICSGIDSGNYRMVTSNELLDRVNEEQKLHALNYPGYHSQPRRSFGTQTEEL